MRLLLFDEAFLGHHAVWMEEILRAVSEIAPGVELSYAFPYAFDTTATHVEWREPRMHHFLRKVQRWTGHPWLVAAKWRALRKLATAARADRVLLLYADEFLHRHHCPRVPFDWIPIYFHPRFLRGYPVTPPLATLQTKTCAFVYVLDGGIASALEGMLRKPVVRIPDFCPSGDARETANCAALRAAAAGRPIVGAIGPVTRHKNIGALLRVAKLRPEWHFLIAGLVFPQALSPEERSLMSNAVLMKNVTVIPDYLPHDELNALTAMCTVQFAAYTNFPHSSNKLARACEYRTPLVVADKGRMADMVRTHQLGETCDPGSEESISRAIASCLAGRSPPADWQGYLSANSLDQLRFALGPLVATDMAGAARVVGHSDHKETT